MSRSAVPPRAPPRRSSSPGAVVPRPLLLLLLLTLVALPLPVTRGACSGAVRQVVVVGAGISGVAAAQHIATKGNGCFQVTVLEARGRVGGRMWSRTESAPPGYPHKVVRGEMGAQWIQTARGNPITRLARSYGLPLLQQNGDMQFGSDGHRYRGPGLAGREASYLKMKRQALWWANRREEDVSVEDAMDRGVTRRQYKQPHVQSRLAVDFEFEYGTSLSKLSSWYYESEGFKFPTLVVTNGYDAIPKRLMASAKSSGATLVLNFAVTAVTLLAAQGKVQVVGVDTTSNTPTTYTADFVIVTLPLGVLKAGSVAFSPSISSSKQGAIDRLGMGVVNKIFFFFNATFWPTGVDEYFIEDRQLPENRGRWVDWLNLRRVWGQTALEGVAVGDYALAMAGMSDAQVIKDATEKMNLMFPLRRDAKGRPVNLLKTWLQRWESDPYARGSYSFAKVGVQGNGEHCTDYNAIGKPAWGGRLLFAGEHTDWTYHATVHGAYLTGIKEAKRVLGTI